MENTVFGVVLAQKPCVRDVMWSFVGSMKA